IEGSEGTNPSHDGERAGSIFNPKREETRDLEHAGNPHGGGMDEGGHGRRTFHGIGQPDVQREHGTLSGTTDEHEEEAEGQHGSTCSKAFLAEVKAERLAVV